ncbi:DUF4198 domain-containing protein [Nicoletella semolina]|uniref:DUF4198 domain-containing protein n=1 Tax=Nicoletella semolina TaxID=271160 RepID=UPI003C7E1087
MTIKKAALIWGALLGSNIANAHNIWIEPTTHNAEYVVKFGHTKTEGYPEHKLKEVKLLDSSGDSRPAQVTFKQSEAYFSAPNATMVLMKFDNGVWSKLPNGKYVQKTKKEVPNAEISLNAFKIGKAILVWNAQALVPQHTDYELVPQAVAKAGEPLSILVLKAGQPLAGVKVGLGEDEPFNLSNEQGIALFTPTKGLNKVWAEFSEKTVNNPDYDERSIEYMLTFDAK